MATIAELQINVDATQADRGKKALDELAQASTRVSKALKDQKAAQDSLNGSGSLGGGSGGSGGGSGNNTKALNDISSAIDNQIKKIKALEAQRESLNKSGLKNTNTAEYERLNQIIDASIERVKRQGNALDQLARQEERSQKQRQDSADRQKKQEEALAAAITAKEAAIANADRKQQESLDRTIGKLYAQVKAQQDYNKTVDELNRARVTQNMTGTGGISAAEYDTYVKRAAAIRDNALAAADNSKEVERLQQRIDSITSSYGAAARAERAYEKSLRDINEGQKQGILTQEQYNTKLKTITEERDRALAVSAKKQQDALDARDAAIARSAAKEDADLNRTLGRLSAQVKAQQEYDRTIEQLNRKRVAGGMMGGTGGISQAEYDDWVKKAQAKRDDTAATDANAAAQERLQVKLDAITSSLGKAQRAEVLYNNQLKTLNDSLAASLITTDQYNQKLTQITEKRDRAVTAANNNTAAEAAFAQQLRGVVVAYDPVLRATDSYNTSVGILAQGLQSGKISAEQFNRALTQQREALERAKAASPGSTENVAKRYQDQIDKLLPLNAQLRSLAEAEKILQQQQAAGKVITEQQILDHQKATAALAAERTEIERKMNASTRAGNSAKQDAAALRGLPAQFSDIVVSLQGGQAPLTVFLQQGAQIKDMFGGVVPALKAMGGAIVAMVTPLTVAAAGFGIFATAAYAAAKEQVEFNKAMIVSAGYAGVSAIEFQNLRSKIDGVIGTAGHAAEALTAIASTGKITSENFEAIAVAAIKMEKATGTAVDDIVKDFASLGKSPVSAAVTLDEKYRFLTSSILATANALVRQGREQDAVILLQSEMAKATDETASKMINNASDITKAWNAVKNTFKEGWDAIKGLTRDQSVDEQIENTKRLIADREKSNSGFFSFMREQGTNDRTLVFFKERLAQLEKYKKATEQQADTERKQEEARRRSVAITDQNEKAYEANLTTIDKVKGAEAALNKIKLQGEQLLADARTRGVALTKEEALAQDTALKAAEKKLQDAKDAKNKPKRTPVDNTELTEVKSDLSVLTNQYDGYFKRITSLREANILSEDAAYYAQKAILTKEAEEVGKSYDAQIAEIKKLQGVKGNSKAQNISLENQLTKAEAARQKAEEDNHTKQQQITARFEGELKKRKDAITSYSDALQKQVDALQAAGDRSVMAVGRGDRQGALNQSLYDNERALAAEQLALSRQKAADQIDDTVYDANLANLEKKYSEMTDKIIDNDKRIQAANQDWTNGFTSAVENAQEAGLNFAGSMKSALTGAFESAGSALATFVTTGKLNFKSFATSVIADMATIAAKQAASGALGALFSIAGAAIGGYFGGANGLAAGSAGATSSSLGASSAGYSSQYIKMAQGGAWNKGTQMFAQGGMFTNSIVSNPTSFGMANGAKGVMGEAGAEAIVPLARTRNGDLGVRMIGGEQAISGGTIINVNVQVSEDSSSVSSDGGTKYDNFGNALGVFVKQEVYKIINTETRPGGTIQPQG